MKSLEDNINKKNKIYSSDYREVFQDLKIKIKKNGQIKKLNIEKK